jgi:translation elongation factor EF-1beta
MFELQYEPLIISENQKPWGIAIVPWDTETFGFGVAFLKPCCDTGDHGNEATAIEKALESFYDVMQAEIITTSVPAEQNEMAFLLQKAGFRFIDLSLSIQYENLKDILAKSSCELSLGPATLGEVEILVEMAGCSFRHGRYHLDPFVPRSLADQRYRDWLNRCLNPENPQRVLAVKHEDTLCGFSVVECRGSVGYLHLHAIDSKWRGKKLGTEMILQSLRHLHDLGSQAVVTKISASNLRAVNIHSRLNGHFITAEYLLHWHRKRNNYGK